MGIQPSFFESDDNYSAARYPHFGQMLGVTYQSDFITKIEEKTLLQDVDMGTWLHDLKRRVQHFGYKYDYKIRRIEARLKIGALPDWLQGLAIKLQEGGYFDNIPDQVIINEYEPGQGITPHIDCEPCFADTVVSLSLNSTAVMEFSKGDDRLSFLLEPRSIIVLSGEARYDWKHAIPARKKDLYQGIVYPRKRRLSLTFRKVIV